jgi:hypothetical protein
MVLMVLHYTVTNHQPSATLQASTTTGWLSKRLSVINNAFHILCPFSLIMLKLITESVNLLFNSSAQKKEVCTFRQQN